MSTHCLSEHALIFAVLGDGTVKTLDMDRKWSTSIFRELMDTAGGTSWERWKTDRIAAGLPILEQGVEERLPLEPIRPKTGAGAVLP